MIITADIIIMSGIKVSVCGVSGSRNYREHADRDPRLPIQPADQSSVWRILTGFVVLLFWFRRSCDCHTLWSWCNVTDGVLQRRGKRWLTIWSRRCRGILGKLWSPWLRSVHYGRFCISGWWMKTCNVCNVSRLFCLTHRAKGTRVKMWTLLKPKPTRR